MRVRLLVATVLGVICAYVPVSAQAATSAYAPDGVLFYPSVAGLLPGLDAPHFCSASVVHSAGRDLVMTAAHCVYGIGATIEFVPGFRGGQAPYGVWSVSRIYVDPGWQWGQSPTRDVAVLAIAPLNGHQIEDVVGARPLGTPTVGVSATVRGYPMSVATPRVCTSTLILTSGYPTVTCPAGGMTDGVSGGAFVQRGRVVGVIGGLQQGGCTATVDYSSPFGDWTGRLLARAGSGGPGDLVIPGFLANICV